MMLGHKHNENWCKYFWYGSIQKALIEYLPCIVFWVVVNLVLTFIFNKLEPRYRSRS